MSSTPTIALEAPYLILIGDVQEAPYVKTGFSIVHWRRELVAGQLRFPGCPVDLGVPDMSVKLAVAAGVRSMIIGAATVGGVLSDLSRAAVAEAANAGLDVVCGLHVKLTEFPSIREAAARSGARLIDVRTPPAELPIGNGRKRSGRRILTVGTDCAVGKKYSALALDEAMRKAGLDSTFRATGQTGIMLAGSGIAVDAVVADFISGAAELVSPDNHDDHWDIIEGQGSLFHPGYAGVSLGLLHGSQPDAVVVCHDAARHNIAGWPDYRLPGIAECIERNVLMGRLTNPDVQCVGICINTSGIAKDDRLPYLSAVSDDIGLPCVDPVIDGCDDIARKIKDVFA